MPYISKNIFFEDREDPGFSVAWDNECIWIKDNSTGGRLNVRKHEDIESRNIFTECEKLNAETF